MEFKKNSVKIIILSGKAESGKSEVANIIKNKLKDNSIILAYANQLKEYAKNISSWDGREETKPRSLLQNLGVELIKNKIDDKFLIRRMLEDIEVYSYFYKYIIISDARFVEEINLIKEKYNNAITINIIGRNNSLTDEQKEHITEKALDNYNNYDYVINNNSNRETLENDIDKILNKL